MIILRLQSYGCKNKGFPTFHNTNINYPCIFAKVNGRGRLPVVSNSLYTAPKDRSEQTNYSDECLVMPFRQHSYARPYTSLVC